MTETSNAYFLAKFRFDTAENEPAKNLQNFAILPILPPLPVVDVVVVLAARFGAGPPPPPPAGLELRARFRVVRVVTVIGGAGTAAPPLSRQTKIVFGLVQG